MAALSGRNARLYAGITSAGTATPIALMATWTLNSSVDDFEVTSFGDSNKTYVAGLPDASGSFSGYYDDSTAQLYTAAQDGVARKTYLYTNTTTNTQYWFGTAIFDFTVEMPVDGAGKVSGNFKASSAFTKIG